MLGDRVTGLQGAGAKPPVPVPVPMDHQGHFPKYFPSKKEIFCPSFCPSSGTGTFRLFNRFVPRFVPQKIGSGTRDISMFVPQGTGTFRILSIDLSIDLSLSLFLSLVIFWRNFLIFNCKIAIIFDPSTDCFFTNLS